MLHKQVDYKLFFSVFILIIFGVIMITSVSVYGSYRVTNYLVQQGTIDQPYTYFYVLRNLFHVFVALIALLFVVKIPYNIFEKYASYILGLNIFLMILVLLVGETYNGATGWIKIPLIPFLLQPVEFLKLGVIIFLAAFFKKYQHNISSFQQGLVPFTGLLIGVVLILAMQPDFGSVMILAPIMVFMFFIAGARIKYLGIFGILGVLLFLGVYNLGKFNPDIGEEKNTFSYITSRIDNFLTDEKDAIANKTINFQTEQALIAIGSGGFWGLGFGNSIQKYGYLPEVQGDFIFSVIIEELGFMGGVLLVCMYGFIGYRGFIIYRYSEDLFAKYVSFGITIWILFQAGVNIGVNLNIIPLTGLTLPFVSYGGSSLLALILGVGLLLNISRYIDESKIGKTKPKRFSQGNIYMYD